MSQNEKSLAEQDADLINIFSATLRPYRSLSRNGFVLLMILFGGTCFAMGFFYMMIGAWPVFGFLGLDVLLVFLAFRMNYNSARSFEEIILRRDQLLIRRISARGQIREIAFNPFWTKLEVRRDDEGVVTAISVRAKGERASIGTFLNPDDKTTFAEAFGAALSEAKGA